MRSFGSGSAISTVTAAAAAAAWTKLQRNIKNRGSACTDNHLRCACPYKNFGDEEAELPLSCCITVSSSILPPAHSSASSTSSSIESFSEKEGVEKFRCWSTTILAQNVLSSSCQYAQEAIFGWRRSANSLPEIILNDFSIFGIIYSRNQKCDDLLLKMTHYCVKNDFRK